MVNEKLPLLQSGYQQISMFPLLSAGITREIALISATGEM
jgi:hypothetical protein